jgi:hypothetical protein
VLLQWGQNKRLRGRRDGASGGGSSPLRGQLGAKIQRRSPVPADKLLMPPPSGPSYTRGSNLRSASPLPPRSGSGIGTSDAHHGRGGLPHPHRYGRRLPSPPIGVCQFFSSAPVFSLLPHLPPPRSRILGSVPVAVMDSWWREPLGLGGSRGRLVRSRRFGSGSCCLGELSRPSSPSFGTEGAFR